MSTQKQSHDNIKIFSWQKDPWQLLWETKQKNRFPHALLILGENGIGKKHFAKALAHAVLCSHTSPQGGICGECHACHLIYADSHPDVIYIVSETPGHTIKVEQIRDAVQFVNETSMQNGFKVIVIHDAHHMNHYAANALLKMLEEPAPNILFILISEERKQLQATITSRCQKLILHKPDSIQALNWLQAHLPPSHSFTQETQEIALKLAAGAPLKALSILTDNVMAYRQTVYEGLAGLYLSQADPLQLAAQWYERDLETLFHLLFYWLHDILKLKSTQNSSIIINTDYKDILINITKKLDTSILLSYLTDVQNRYSKIIHSLNLNRQLLVEELLIRWVSINRM